MNIFRFCSLPQRTNSSHDVTFIIFFFWFFLTEGKKLCPIQLIKKSITKDTKVITKDYFPGMMLPKCLAHALTHNLASALILSIATWEGVCLLRKTLALRSFQIFHVIRRVSDDIAFLLGAVTPTNMCHQCSMERPSHCVGCMDRMPIQFLIATQMRVV
jgi:hypothetical protein